MSERDQKKRRTAIVTGGTQGIGLAIAQALVDDGWSVTAVGLELPSTFVAAGPLHFLQADISDPAAVHELVADHAELHALVNAAGMISRQQEFELDTFARVLEVNLTATMRVSKAAYPKLAESRGAIVNIASMLSFFGGGLVPAYSASKGGIVQLTKSLAIAWAAEGIRVNAVAPGWIETAMTDPLRSDAKRNSAILDRTPMRRWGRPEEVAGPVKFLLSADASFMTGSVLTVDGGYACF